MKSRIIKKYIDEKGLYMLMDDSEYQSLCLCDPSTYTYIEFFPDVKIVFSIIRSVIYITISK